MSAQALPQLLRSIEEPGVRAASQSQRSRPGMDVRRSRHVAIDQSVLVEQRIALDLFPGTQIEVDALSSRWSDDGSTHLWVGKIAGMTRGQVVLAATGDIVSANITTDTEEFYWIRQVDGDVHVVQHIEARPGRLRNDSVRVPPGEFEEAGGIEKSRTPERLALVDRDAGNTAIDILVCYTVAARNAAGGTAAIQNKIQLAVAETNQGYVNSNIGIDLRLAGTLEVNYDESSGIDAALTRLRGSSDGYMDEVHAARNSLGADMVSLWIEDVGSMGGVIGLGYLMTNVSSSFSGLAFSATEQYWAAGPGYAFSHELGHNMGAEHDRLNAGGEGAYPYSYGYQQTNLPTRFRTIMAYGCDNVWCPAINYWSNPAVSYSGAATGVASTSLNSADNALTLNNSKATVSAFRSGGGGCFYSISPGSGIYGVAGGSGTISVTAGTGCAWTATTASSWITVTSGASGSGNGSVGYSVASNTGASRTGSISIGGQTFAISQSAVSCSYSISPGSASYNAGGGYGFVNVTAGAGCGWT
ncbi:MAG TPA: M12 family metallo-peptidase, partial [Bryobacteraceae bacterium]|nr:M12 family metallo-peptidase [Bryobacteraceae bacterium]